MKIEPAIKEIIVPSDALKWPQDRAQEWAKGILAGGPPDIPEDPRTGNKIEWKELKSWVGKKIRIRARPKGLIIYSDDGAKRFVAGDTASSKKTSSHKLNVSTKEMRKRSDIESRIREFAKNEIKIYNKKITKEIRLTQKTTTYEFWESGKRIRFFLRVMCQYSPQISLFLRRYFHKFLVTKIEMKKVTEILPAYIFRVMKTVSGFIAMWGSPQRRGLRHCRSPWERLND